MVIVVETSQLLSPAAALALKRCPRNVSLLCWWYTHRRLCDPTPRPSLDQRFRVAASPTSLTLQTPVGVSRSTSFHSRLRKGRRPHAIASED